MTYKNHPPLHGVRTAPRKAYFLALATLAGLSPVVGQAQSWNGFSLGLDGGAIRSHVVYETGPDDQSWFKTTNETASMRATGDHRDADYAALLGLTLGYDHQTGPWVYGAELGLNATQISLATRNTYNYTNSARHYTYRQEATCTGLHTLSARAGYAFGPSLLSASAGLAVTRIRTSLDFVDDYAVQYASHGSEKGFWTGWTLGLGYRRRLANGFALRANASYVALGKDGLTSIIHAADGTSITGMNFASKVRLNTYTLGVEKRF
ncbi:MAG: outer membrane beta-barrel protein [Holophaga sp.]|nr:outer membrane beta-barrel protein [Holophaga sp.]